jgi:hypothetical protein
VQELIQHEEASMKRIRQSMILSLGLVLTACLLAAAAAPVRPEKKCYNADGEEIPCDSNYLQTKEAAKATARNNYPSLPTITPTFTPTPSPTPTATETVTETPAPTAAQLPQAAPPAASAPQPASSQPSTIQLLIPVAMLGCAGLLAVFLVFMLFRWLLARRAAPPGPPR